MVITPVHKFKKGNLSGVSLRKKTDQAHFDNSQKTQSRLIVNPADLFWRGSCLRGNRFDQTRTDM